MFLFTQFSIIVLASLLLLIVVIYEISQFSNSNPARLRMFAFTVPFILYLGIWLWHSTYYSLCCRPLEKIQYLNTMLVALAYAELCRYIANVNSRYYIMLSRTLYGVAFAIWLYIWIQAIVKNAPYDSEYYTLLVSINSLILLWVFIFLGVCVYRRTKIFPLFLWKASNTLLENDYTSKATLGFFTSTFIFILACSIEFIWRIFDTPLNGWPFVYYIFISLILSTIAINYFFHVEVRANIATRITAIMTITFLSIIVVVTILFNTEDINIQYEDSAVLNNKSLAITKGNNAEYQISSIEKDWVNASCVFWPIMITDSGLS